MTFYHMQKIGNVLLLDIFNEIQASKFAEDFGAISGDVQTIIMHVNCTGGDLKETKKIYDLLENHPAQKTGYVVTYAASSAAVLLMSCDVVSVPSNAVMVLHRPYVSLQNETAAVLRQTADLLDVMEEFVVSAYIKKSNLPKNKIKELMDACTWLKGTEALALGLCNEVTDPVALVPVFDPSKFARLNNVS